MEQFALLLFLTALVAACVNGGLGYGFSSLTVPVALGFVANRVLNPALVLLEVVLNLLSLVLNRRGLAAVWRRTLPLLVGLVPGVALGSLLLVDTGALALKAATYALLLPLVLLQFAGSGWRVEHERFEVGVPAGVAVGVLYSATTISGPPLAMLLGGRDLSQDEFRASLAIVRVAESVFSLVAYAALGLFTTASFEVFSLLVPAVAIGVPLGRFALRTVSREGFRRVYLSVDAGLISAGLAVVLHKLGWVDAAVAAAGAAALIGFLVGTEWMRVRLRQQQAVPE